MALIKRLVKGSKITPAENDDNLDWLNEAGTSTSSTIYLNRGTGWNHYASGINPLTGSLTIDLDYNNASSKQAIESGFARVFWTSSDGSWPTVSVLNGDGLGVAGADITSVTPNGNLPGAGDYEIVFVYGLGKIKMFTPENINTTVTLPTVTSAEIGNVSSSIIRVMFSKQMDTASVPATTDNTVTTGGSANAVTNVSLGSNYMDLTLTTPVTTGQAVVWSYVSGTNPLRDNTTSHNELADVTNYAVTNNVSASVETNWTVANNVLMSASGTEYTSTTTVAWTGRILASEFLAGDGYIVADVLDLGNTGNAMLKIHNVNANDIYTATEGLAVFLVNGTYYTLVSGASGVSSGVSAQVGDRMRVIRTGTNVKAQYYRGGTWSDLIDWGNSTAMASGNAYCQGICSAQASNYYGTLYNPKIYQ